MRWPGELGVIPYVSFRSQAETVETPEKAWTQGQWPTECSTLWEGGWYEPR